MNKVFIDTNVLLYLIDKSSIFNLESEVLLASLPKVNSIGIINPYIINEFHYQTCKQYTKTDAIQITNEILKLENIQYKDIEFTKTDVIKIAKISDKYNLKTFDAYHAYYCKKEKIKQMATFDSDFKNIPWLKIYKSLI